MYSPKIQIFPAPIPVEIYTLPILDTLQKMTNSLLVNVDIPIDTERLVRISLYPSKIDLERFRYFQFQFQ